MRFSDRRAQSQGAPSGCLTFATSVLHSKGISWDALDVAPSAVHNQALGVRSDVLNRHAGPDFVAHLCAPFAAKLSSNLICLTCDHCQDLLFILQQTAKLLNPEERDKL